MSRTPALSPSSSSSSRAFLLLGAAALAPIALRLAQISHAQATLGWADLRGLAADLALSLLVCLGLRAALAAPRIVTRWVLAAALMTFWVLLNFGNHENFLALGSMANWGHAGFLFDRTFLLGSALHVTQPWLLAGILAACMLLLFLASRAAGPASSRRWLLITLLALLAVPLLPTSGSTAAWRQTHFVLENLRWLTAGTDLEETTQEIAGLFPGSLDGAPVVEVGHPGTNVLLVILEGISGAYLDSMARAQAHTVGDRPRMPTLNALAQRGYTATNFVNHQRQTNRGVYSLLCGDLPKLTTAAPKMSELALMDGVALCLPEALRRKGYATAFLQAAPLDFMAKDKFMPRAGFSRNHGLEWFQGVEGIGIWGVDDQQFFRSSLGLIEQLQAGESPWFLTLLTSGTHHPFRVPDSFVGSYPMDTFARAVEYLDLALAEFLPALESLGVLEDTLVVFASDESFGLEGDLDDDATMMSQAWGVLTAHLPGGEQRQISEPFMQADVAISVLDYLGLDDVAVKFGGRSFFREYPTPRAIPFANTYMRMVGGLGTSNDLFLCGEDFADCRKYQLDDRRRLFAERSPAAIEAGEAEFLRLATARSLQRVMDDELGSERSWALVETPQEMQMAGNLLNQAGIVKLFGDQYLSLARRERIDTDLVIHVDGADVGLTHMLTAVPQSRMPTLEEFRADQKQEAERMKLGPSVLGMRPVFAKNAVYLMQVRRVVRAGETFELRYSVGAEETLERLNSLMFAQPLGTGNVRLRFERADLKVTRLEPSEATGLQVHHYSHANAPGPMAPGSGQ